MKSDFAMIHSLARSGSTLISRCLGCIKGNTLLSEVHPRWSHFNPLIQANQWFGLISDKELKVFKDAHTFDYGLAINLIRERCNEQGLKLIIRDWTHIDFTPGPYPVKPVYHFFQYDLLKPYFQIPRIVLTRDPLDAYLSLANVPDQTNTLHLESYMEGFRSFASQAVSVGFVRFEDFCDTPERTLQKMCSSLHINYDKEFLHHWETYTRITGDIPIEGTTMTRVGVEIRNREPWLIRRPTRRTIDPWIISQLKKNKDYCEAVELLGYSPAWASS